MSHFLIDGYNVLHRETAGVIEDDGARERLVSRIRLFSARHMRDRFTLVFDGSPRFLYPAPVPIGNFRVLFAIDESADSLIKRLLDAESRAASAIVVTDDREIRDYARARRAGILNSLAFLERIACGTGAGPASPLQDEGIRPQDVSRVNEEILSEWRRKYGE